MFVLIGYYFRELFVIDFDTFKGSIYLDDDVDVIVIMINLELDKIFYYEEIVIIEYVIVIIEIF